MYLLKKREEKNDLTDHFQSQGCLTLLNANRHV